jgi:hypothetical protein
MKTKFKIAFFLGLGLFGFGSFKSLKTTAQMIFWFTLIIWIVTLFFVSYVGVYLSYIAVPILIISGLVFLISNGKFLKKSSLYETI